MLMFWGVLLLLLKFHYIICGIVPSEQISGLEYFYNSTNLYDHWKSNYTEYGIPWNFTSIEGNLSNPCISDWQGISCNTDCSTANVCDIIELSLEDYGFIGTITNNIHLLSQLQVYE